MEKELRCNSCKRLLHKYEAIYIGGRPICPYCENNAIEIKVNKEKNNKEKKKSIFKFFK